MGSFFGANEKAIILGLWKGKGEDPEEGKGEEPPGILSLPLGQAGLEA